MPSLSRIGEGRRGRNSNSHHRPTAGVRETARSDGYAEQSGESLVFARPAGEDISRRVRARASDEAVVSDDLAGQQNPPGSQGPLDRRDAAAAPPDMPARATGATRAASTGRL